MIGRTRGSDIHGDIGFTARCGSGGARPSECAGLFPLDPRPLAGARPEEPARDRRFKAAAWQKPAALRRSVRSDFGYQLLRKILMCIAGNTPRTLITAIDLLGFTDAS